jgi:hypothetical protein
MLLFALSTFFHIVVIIKYLAYRLKYIYITLHYLDFTFTLLLQKVRYTCIKNVIESSDVPSRMWRLQFCKTHFKNGEFHKLCSVEKKNYFLGIRQFDIKLLYVQGYGMRINIILSTSDFSNKEHIQ